MQAKKIETLTFSLKTEAGSLGEVYRAFREEGLNVKASWAYQMGPNEAQAHVWTEDNKLGETILEKLGKKVTKDHACWVQGTDKTGAYAELLQKLAEKKINIEATDAMAIDGKWSAVFFTDKKDIDTLCSTLGA